MLDNNNFMTNNTAFVFIYKNKNTLLWIQSSVTKEKVIRAVTGSICTCGLFYGVTNKKLAQYEQI